ncbi:hypothetical protein M5595_20955 [Eubacterium limosum]|uniref:hypothetical protein n=1 Tax=Eubacterium limosum TaxID=1736 RepID=UPI00201E045B|nr:hypothetical protein [Eubacterium limosum]UQZ22644.1 hypothetical protein M5595_20955 [Eubacterium limosum]
MKLNTEGTGAFASFEEQAKSATGGIGTQLQNMKTAVTRGIANVLDAIGQDTIGKAFAGINGVIKGVSDVVVEMVKRVKESGLGDALEDFMNLLNWPLNQSSTTSALHS